MMKRIRKTFKRRYFRNVIIYFLTWCLVLNTSLPAVLATPTPVDGGFTEGTGTITQVGTATNVVVDQAQSVIEWSSLDTIGGAPGVRESLNFSQGGLTNSAVLNRVVSGYGTQFYGDLNAAGMRIFIVNPAGVVFGEGSTVNVTQLIASSLNISNDKFLSGDYEFAGDIEGADVYERLGVINNSNNMYGAEGVALIGRKILNTGTISTGEGGFVVMAAGDRVLLGAPGSNILTEMYSVALPEEGDGDVINDGQISAPAGTVVLAAGDVFSSALELPKVSGGVGRVEQNGQIHANGTTGDGGNISLTAADDVVLASGSQTTANAATGGDAGLVVVHSQDRTTVETNALIQATGGHTPEPGYGGFEDVVDATVEISGDYVNFAGSINASATGGKRGKIVIDALDMTVAKGSKPAAPLDNTVYETWVENQSKASTDVELVAHSRDAGNITVARMTDGEITGGSGDIVLRTKYDTGAITFLTDGYPKPTAIHTTNGGNIYMLAGEGGITTGDIVTDVPSSDKVTEPGKIRLLTTNYGDISTGRLSVNGGSYDEISVIASGDLTINGNVQTITNQVPSDTQYVGQARNCLVSEHGDVDITGQVTVEAHGKYNTTADIHIDAGQDIKINLGGGQIKATAKTSSTGPANASVLIHAGKDIEGPGTILITDDGVNPTTRSNAIYLEAKPGGGLTTAQVSYGDDPSLWDEEQGAVYDENGNLIEGAHAKLEIDENRTSECPECPTPPGLVPPLDPWAFTTHMEEPITGNVLQDDSLEIIYHTEPRHGSLIILENGDYQYTPNDGFVGQDRFTYRAITDKGVETDLVEVTINVSNELPVANPGLTEKHMGVTIVEPLNAQDTSDIINEIPYDDDIIVEIVEQPLYGTVTVQKVGDTWTYTYTPTKDGNGEYHVGTDSFTYSVTDAQGVVGSSGTATVTINLINNPPVQTNDTVVIDQGQSVIIDVLVNDYDPDYPEYTDNLTVVQDSVTVQHGQLILNDDNTFTYIPDPGYTGQDSFTYAVKDGQSGEELVWTTVEITVKSTVFVTVVPYIQPAPGLERIEIQYSGCPALVKWVAAELGTDERNVQIWMANSLASTREIQPCDACTNLKAAATILQDVDGTRVAALAQVISQFASSTAPPTEEQMASIADAIANDIEGNGQYAAAGEYLDALAKYVGVLTTGMGFSADESVQFATENYVQKLADGENVGVAAYVAARLAALGGS
jgi:filamentous hemagglutinin family protein